MIIPFKWKDRRPFISKYFLYIPSYYDKHLKFQESINFENDNDIFLEYCSGNGTWIIEKAIKNPLINWIAVEKRLDRAKLIYKKIKQNKLKNVFVVVGDGLLFAKYYCLERKINKIFINFPDPWPKRKHAKNRIMTNSFIEDMKKSLKKGGELFFVSDCRSYIEEVIKKMLSLNSWEAVFPKPYFVNSFENYGNSFFEELFRKKDLLIFYLNFRKK